MGKAINIQPTTRKTCIKYIDKKPNPTGKIYGKTYAINTCQQNGKVQYIK